MRVIGLDTSTDTGGVALLDGERLLAEYTLALRRTTHSEQLLPAVERVLAGGARVEGRGPKSPERGTAVSGNSSDAGRKAPVQGVAVAVGPGSFTGLRIGVVTAKALAYTWQVPVVGVSTLDALAYQAAGAGAILCAMMNARHGNAYVGVYDGRGDGPVPLIEPGLRSVADWLPALDAQLGTAGFGDEIVTFIGDGVGVYWELIRQQLGDRARRVGPVLTQLRSGAVAALGRQRLLQGDSDDLMGLAPVYLRKSEAERKWEQRESKSRSNS